MATSVGWAQEADIKTDLKVAQKGKPIVFSVTTQKGSEDKTVRVELKMNTVTNLSGWKMEYYEANQQPIGWKDWTPENGVYMYGPANGFPLIDGTSYFRITPATVGEYTYSLSIKEASGGTVVKKADFNLAVSENAAASIASIGNENYASLSAAVAFAAENATINLSEGNFLLDRMLVINKPLSIKALDPTNTIIQPLDPNNWIIPSGMKESEYKHLITILGDATGTVTLENVTVGSSLASGINAQSSMKTVLNNVYLSDNANAGLLVHSTVEAKGLHTQQNKWGSVNVDKSTKTSYTVSFKFDAASSFEEPTKIWSEITDKEDIVTAPKGWTSYLGKGGSDNTTDMRYWKNSKLDMEFYAQFPSNSKYTNTYFIYANGQPVTVSPSTKEGYIKVGVDGTDDFLEIPESNNPVIFGGSKYKDVESSHITMTGGKVSMIFGGGYLGNVGNVDVTITGGHLEGYFVGGGYGPKAKFEESKRITADVTGKITAKISNAYVRYLVSGGMEHARTETTDISITGDNTDILYGLGGGFAPVSIGQTLNTEYNDIANRTGTAKLSMTGGKISGCFYIGGGYSYSYTKDITATFNGVAVEGGMKGVGSNGRSNTVTATFTKCNFSKGEKAYTPSIAAVNRGKADAVSMSFNDCTFTSDIKCYLGADTNWQDSSFPVPVSEKAIFSFTGANVPSVQLSEGMQYVTLTGAKANADVFIQKAGAEIKTFTIPAEKTWSFNNGLTIANDVTLTKTGTLAVNGTLTISKVDQLAMALSSVTSGGTIDLSSIKAANMLEELNKGEKKDLTAGICIKCSDATVYTDMTSAQLSSAAGAQYIKLAADTYSLETPKALTIKPTIKTKPVASTLEAGQPLSASILSEGIAVEGETEVAVSGVFSWKTPSEVATVGTKSYDVVFTPSDLTKYEVVNTQVEIKDVKQYYTVTIGKCDNGKVEVTEGNTAGKYVDGTTLAVKAIPNDHYNFSAWATGITGAADNGSYTVNKDAVTANAVLSATFVAKKYTVTIGKNVKVTDQEGKTISAGDLPYGTVLNVVAAPTEEVGSLKSLTYNGKEVINNTVTVDGVLNIQATFNAFVPSTYRITAGTMTNGKIQLFDENGNTIAFGSALTKGKVVSVVPVPDPGYELDGTVTVTDATYKNGKFTVGEKDVTVSTTFKPKKYKVEIAAEYATITLDNNSGLDNVDYGTSITISKAEAKKDYKLLAVVVNGKEIAEGESFIVKGDTRVNAVVQKLPDVVFTDVNQTYTFNNAEQAFVVRTVPAGISGITITYKQGENDIPTPTDAGTYRVFATLGANSSYASMTAKEIGTLKIDKAPYPAAPIPTVKDVNDNDAENEYHWKSTAVGNFRTAYYKLPSNLLSNYREPEFVIPSTSELEYNLTKVTLGEGSWVKTRSTTVSLTLNASGGSVSVWNGDVQVTNVTPLYAGQKLTLKAIPANATYSTRPEWSDNVAVDKDGVASITLPDDNATVIATFAPKDNAPFTPQNYTSIYTGTAFGTNAAPTLTSDVSGWVVSFEQDGIIVNEPTAVGNYTMKASRSEDDVHKATTVTVGTLHITKATAEIIQAAGTDITTIQTLNQSAISGTTNVEGTFSWVNPDVKLGVGTHEIDVLFTPTDNNYAPVKGKATVKVTALASEVAVRTIELTESDPANGNGVVLTLNGTEVTAGTTVKAGDKLTATFSAKEHYTASAKINDASYTSGNEYEVKDETGNVTIAITYTQKSGPTPTPNPEPGDDVTNVTGVSLDVTSKTLAVGESFALKATVKPADADNKKVSWSSSDATIASVDKDGNVKALKAGTCKITATTEDGDYTATCDVTVTIATGIDEILTVNRIYTDYRQIIVEPTTMLEVLISDLNGRIIYNGRTAEKISVSVSGGMYIVRLIDGKRVAATKVIVK